MDWQPMITMATSTALLAVLLSVISYTIVSILLIHIAPHNYGLCIYLVQIMIIEKVFCTVLAILLEFDQYNIINKRVYNMLLFFILLQLQMPTVCIISMVKW